MIPHKEVITCAFVAAGLYFGFTVVRDFDSILATHRAFFDHSPAWQANISATIIALLPLGFFAVALAVYRRAKWWVALIPAILVALLTTGLIAIVLIAYLVIYYTIIIRADRKVDPRI